MIRTAIASALVALGATIASAQPQTCSTSSTALCLSASRFQVTVHWQDFQGNTGEGQAVGLTADTGYFWFFDASNVELIVKVLDARSINGKFWVFFGALSNVQYDMTVRDSATGASKTYHNPSGQFASVGDTSAFDGGAGAIASRESVLTSGTRTPQDSMAAIQSFIGASTSRPVPADFTPCLAPVTDLYLSSCRFQLEASWQDAQGNSGDGQAVQLTDDTGYFWFFSASNVELVIKVLDARAVNGDFWVFFGALSNVQYKITVLDTLSGDIRTYTNPQGTFASVGDTTAFQPLPAVAAVLDDTRAVSDLFDNTGGTLTATGADGTQYVLTLPANALVLPAQVTLTPVTSVAGPAVNGPFLFGVQIQPDGLFLVQAADLKILPPSLPSTRNLTYFRYRGSGESFTPYPGTPNATGIELPISYLAGYGVATGSASASSLERARRPQDGGSFASYVAQAANLYRQMFDQEIDYQTYLAGVYEVWAAAWANVVWPTLNALGSECNPEAMIAAFRMGLEFLHLDPESDPSYSNYNEQVFAIIKQKVLDCIDAAYQRCKANYDPSEAQVMLDMDQVLQQASLLSEDDQAMIWEKIRNCLHFDVDFESTLTIQGAGGDATLTEELKVRAIVPMFLDAGEHYHLAGSSQIYFELATAYGNECTYTLATEPDTFTIDNFCTGNLTAGPSRGGADAAMGMVYSPGNPQIQLTQSCPVTGSNTGPWAPDFQLFYGFFHTDETRQALGDNTYIALNWTTIRNGNFFAKKEYIRTQNLVGLGDDSEDTVIFLKHTPQ